MIDVAAELGYGQPLVEVIEAPEEVEREFSPEFKKARKRFGKLVEKKIDDAADANYNTEQQMAEAVSAISHMKWLEDMD